MNKVCVAGLWHLGLVSAAALADMGFQVIGYDPDVQVVENLRRGIPPLFEPGLEELIRKHIASGHLRFENTPAAAVKEAGTVLITYDTPVDDQDNVDLTLVQNALNAVLPYLRKESLIIINSQIPVTTSEGWQKQIDRARPGEGIDLVYSPENLRLGQAIELFKNPDMIVIGSNSVTARKKAELFYSPFSSEKIFVSWRTAEMAKHALNAFFATSISFANEIGNLCDALGADGMDIAKILKKDSRIGKKAQVRPGLGFAGATLARDLQCLKKTGRAFGIPTQLVESVLDINQKQTGRVLDIVEAYFKGRLQGKTLAVLGLTYKPGTSTLRRSSSLEIIELLEAKGARIKAHDPKADFSELKGEVHFEKTEDAYAAVEKADGLLLLTEWPEYRGLDFIKIKQSMKTPFILDVKNHLNGDELKPLGFDYFEIGRGQMARSACTGSV